MRMRLWMRLAVAIDSAFAWPQKSGGRGVRYPLTSHIPARLINRCIIICRATCSVQAYGCHDQSQGCSVTSPCTIVTSPQPIVSNSEAVATTTSFDCMQTHVEACLNCVSTDTCFLRLSHRIRSSKHFLKKWTLSPLAHRIPMQLINHVRLLKVKTWL